MSCSQKPAHRQISWCAFLYGSIVEHLLLAGRELMIIPGSRGFEYICPGIRVEEFCVKIVGKIRVFKAWRVVFTHEINFFWSPFALPPVPEPLTILPVGRDREDSPVDENPDLRLVVPLWQGSGIQTGPIVCVTRCASSPQHEED